MLLLKEIFMHCNWVGRVANIVVLLLAGCGRQTAVTGGQPVTASGSGGVTPAVSATTGTEHAVVAQSREQIPDAKQPNVAAEVGVAAPAIDDEVRQPATVAEASQAIDLSKFPLMPGATDAGKRVVASLGYEVAGDAKSVFEFQRRTLLDWKWKELSEPQIYDDSASGQYGKGGYHVSVTVFPRGEPGKVSVRLQNHSNVNLSKLPIPPETKFQ